MNFANQAFARGAASNRLRMREFDRPLFAYSWKPALSVFEGFEGGCFSCQGTCRKWGYPRLARAQPNEKQKTSEY